MSDSRTAISSSLFSDLLSAQPLSKGLQSVLPNENSIVTPTNADRRGRFELDYLNLRSEQTAQTTSPQPTTVVLGDALGSYYIADGWQDHVYIEGFDTQQDSLLLYGDHSLYTFEDTQAGTWLRYGDDGTTAIAFLEGVSTFELADDSANSAIAFISAITTDDEPIQEKQAIEEQNAKEQDAKEPTVEEPVRSQDFYLQLGVPAFETVAGNLDDDLLLGGDRADQIMGFGGRDYAFGGGGADLFILGDFGGAYYAREGWEDSVYIDDFTAGEDQLQLHGSIEQYSTESTEEGLWLYAEGEVIAYFNGVRSLDLTAAEYRSL